MSFFVEKNEFFTHQLCCTFSMANPGGIKVRGLAESLNWGLIRSQKITKFLLTPPTIPETQNNMSLTK